MFFTNSFVCEYQNKKTCKTNNLNIKFIKSFLKYAWTKGAQKLIVTVKLKTGSTKLDYLLTKNLVYDAWQLQNKIQTIYTVYDLTSLVYVEFECL